MSAVMQYCTGLLWSRGSWAWRCSSQFATQSIYIPTITCSHEFWVMTKRMRSLYEQPNAESKVTYSCSVITYKVKAKRQIRAGGLEHANCVWSYEDLFSLSLLNLSAAESHRGADLHCCDCLSLSYRALFIFIQRLV